MADQFRGDPASAYIDLHHYLSALVPPLQAAPALVVLSREPVDAVLAQIRSWVAEQHRSNPAAPEVDYLFHAFRKLIVLVELELVDRDEVDPFLDRLIATAVTTAAPEDRKVLRARILPMRQRLPLVATSPGIQALPASTVKVEAAPPPPAELQRHEREEPQDRRLGIIVERISRERAARPASEPPAGAIETLARLVCLAVLGANDWDSLRESMKRIPPLVSAREAGNLFQLLSRAIPPWEAVPQAIQEECVELAALRAMFRTVIISEQGLDRPKRYRDFLMAAVERFNTGALPAAAAMLSIAPRVAAAAEIDRNVVQRIESDARAALDLEQVRRYAENRVNHPALRNALGYFPALRAEGLLHALRGEKKPERRRALLSLLEAWGPEARARAIPQLEQELGFGPGADTYFLRNLIFLLHRIPREVESEAEQELDLLTRATARGQSIYVIREAVTALGTIRNEGAARVLAARLRDHESALLRNDTSVPWDEVQKVLDRATAALARIGTPSAFLALARHGVRVDPILGDTRARLAPLSQADLSSEPETVELLISTIHNELPGKILGRVMAKGPNTVPLIEALSGTRTEAVRSLMEEISERYSQQELGRAAAAALEKLSREPAPPVRETTAAPAAGALEPYALPGVIMSLAETAATGVLTIATPDRQVRARLLFRSGSVVRVRDGKMSDEDAFCRLLENPAGGFYAFSPQDVPGGGEERATNELLLEAMRRHDALGFATLLVPDDASIAPSTVRPTAHPDESDRQITREVWARAASGAPVASWEGQIAADPFRVRRLLAHWVEEGSLTLASTS